MLTYVVGDIFKSPAHVFVNTVNTVGVMGKGIAKKFKMIYPEMFKEYQRLCETKKLTIGKLYLYKTSNKWILNFPTKKSWRQPSKISYIENGLKAFVKGYAGHGITSIAFPALGCGNGELRWDSQVRPLMDKYLRRLPIDIFIYNYYKKTNTPEHQDIKAISKWLRTEPESLGFEEVWLDLRKMIGEELELKSFYGENIFRVRRLGEKEGLRIIFREKNLDISYDELLDLWNIIRSYGFVFSAVIPPFANPYIDYLLSLFAKLPYFEEIIASKNSDFLGKSQARGIQYIPKAVIEPPLFKKIAQQLIAV
jgi:O-acetyl-ADP-ribose deacetylase (regulator of RNase III)